MSYSGWGLVKKKKKKIKLDAILSDGGGGEGIDVQTPGFGGIESKLSESCVHPSLCSSLLIK